MVLFGLVFLLLFTFFCFCFASLFSFCFFFSLVFSCLLALVVLICFLLLAVSLEVLFSPEDPATTCGETQCSLVCLTDDHQLQSAPKVTLAYFYFHCYESEWLSLFLCFIDALCVEGDCCFGLLVDARSLWTRWTRVRFLFKKTCLF